MPILPVPDLDFEWITCTLIDIMHVRNSSVHVAAAVSVLPLSIISRLLNSVRFQSVGFRACHPKVERRRTSKNNHFFRLRVLMVHGQANYTTSLASGQHFKSGGHRRSMRLARLNCLPINNHLSSSIVNSNNLLRQLSTSTIARLDKLPNSDH